MYVAVSYRSRFFKRALCIRTVGITHSSGLWLQALSQNIFGWGRQVKCLSTIATYVLSNFSRLGRGLELICQKDVKNRLASASQYTCTVIHVVCVINKRNSFIHIILLCTIENSATGQCLQSFNYSCVAQHVLMLHDSTVTSVICTLRESHQSGQEI